MSTILVKVGKRFYKARVNPKPSLLDDDRYAHLCRLYARCSKLGQLKRMITLERQIRKMERKNPLVSSRSKTSIGKNISWLMHHPKELTAKTNKMRHKQAIAIALSVWRRAQK